MSQEKIRITYFAIRGRQEITRLILEEKQIPYEDIRINFEDWEKMKPTLEFEQLPLYEEGKDIRIVQSHAIYRYLARKYNLYGKDEKEYIRVNIAEEAGAEALTELVELFWDPDFNQKRDEFVKNQLSKRMELLNQFFLSNPSKSNHFWVGNQLTLADFIMWQYLDCVRAFSLDTLKSFPSLFGFYEHFRSIPNIKKYLESDRRPETYTIPFAFFGGTKETS